MPNLGLLKDWATGENSTMEKKVSDVIHQPDRTWDLVQLAQLLHPLAVEAIQQIPLPMFTTKDKFMWSHNRSGTYPKPIYI